MLLEVRNLSFSYGDTLILDNFSFAVKNGEILCIEGKNGAGKTTLLNCISGVINQGKNIFLNDIDLSKDLSERSKISFVMSNDTLYDYLTLSENVTYYEYLLEENSKYVEKVYELCKLFNVLEYREQLIKNLSQGTRNKVYLSIMLAIEHDLLILDEPFTALDAKSQELVFELINEYKKSHTKVVILVTHIEKFKQLATRKINLG